MDCPDSFLANRTFLSKYFPDLQKPPNNIFRLPDIYIFEGEAEYDEQHFPRCGGAKLAANKWHSCAFQPSGW